MRTPDLLEDGWRLDDGEQRHREAPSTFSIPSMDLRNALQPGDLAKLIFVIAVEDIDQSEQVERMWVVVSQSLAGHYVGILDNEPSCISKNGSFWAGSELPFEPRHIIAVEHANDASMAVARASPAIPWGN